MFNSPTALKLFNNFLQTNQPNFQMEKISEDILTTIIEKSVRACSVCAQIFWKSAVDLAHVGLRFNSIINSGVNLKSQEFFISREFPPLTIIRVTTSKYWKLIKKKTWTTYRHRVAWRCRWYHHWSLMKIVEIKSPGQIVYFLHVLSAILLWKKKILFPQLCTFALCLKPVWSL